MGRETLATALAALALALVLLLGRAPSPPAAEEPRKDLLFAALERCLIGEPLERDEPASQRLRRIELTALATPDLPDAWPHSCARHAAALAAGPARVGDVAYFAAQLEHALQRRDALAVDVVAIVDRLFERASREGFARVDAGSVAPPPAAAAPLTMDDLATYAPLADARTPLDALQLDRVPGGVLRLLVGSQLCEVGASGERARCGALPASINVAAAELRLLGSAEDGAASLVFAAPSGEMGIFRSDTGARVDALAAYGGFSRANGFVAVLGWDVAEKMFKLARVRPGRPPSELFFHDRSILFDNRMALLWDHVVYASEGVLAVQRVLEGDAPLAPTVTLGPLPRIHEAGEALRACKTSEAFFVLVRATGGDRMAVLAGDRWSDILPLSGSGGRLACGGGAASVTRIDTAIEQGGLAGTITEDLCTARGCASSTVSLRDIFRGRAEAVATRERDVAVERLGEDLVVIWRSARGGVRMRRAAPSALAQASDLVVLDDLVPRGELEATSALVGFRMIARPRFLALLVATTLGVNLLVIDASGRVTPLAVARD